MLILCAPNSPRVVYTHKVPDVTFRPNASLPWTMRQESAPTSDEGGICHGTRYHHCLRNPPTTIRTARVGREKCRANYGRRPDMVAAKVLWQVWRSAPEQCPLLSPSPHHLEVSPLYTTCLCPIACLYLWSLQSERTVRAFSQVLQAELFMGPSNVAS
jgi:hypothetical protein